MKTLYPLFLASESHSRRRILKECDIPYTIVGQNADEAKCNWTLPIQQVVADIARMKMDHVDMPKSEEGDIVFVLTADTLTLDSKGNLLGKPTDCYEAIKMIKQIRDGACTGSAFCLDKKVFRDGKWQIIDRIEGYAQAQHIFDVPDQWIDTYLEQTARLGAKTARATKCAGAIAIEEFGQQFVKSIDGSYSAILGLPVFELRQALEKLGFWEAIV